MVLKGDTNIRYLAQNKVKIWNEWPFQTYLEAKGLTEKYPMYSPQWKEAMEKFVAKIVESEEFASRWGDLGPVYGKQWIRWQAPDGSAINQIELAQDMIRKNPDSRRVIVSGWNVPDIQALVKSKTAAPPLCHTVFQFITSRRLATHPHERFQLARRVLGERPELQMIDYDDYQKSTGSQKAREFFNP